MSAESLPGTYTMKNRIAPREFRAFVLPSKDANLETNLKTLRSVQKKAGVRLSIYDSEGNLLWPQEISHQEIVQMLKEKEG